MGIVPAFPLRGSDKACQKMMDIGLDLKWYWGSLYHLSNLALGEGVLGHRSSASLSCHPFATARCLGEGVARF